MGVALLVTGVVIGPSSPRSISKVFAVTGIMSLGVAILLTGAIIGLSHLLSVSTLAVSKVSTVERIWLVKVAISEAVLVVGLISWPHLDSVNSHRDKVPGKNTGRATPSNKVAPQLSKNHLPFQIRTIKGMYPVLIVTTWDTDSRCWFLNMNRPRLEL